jgi:hypothetical protein
MSTHGTNADPRLTARIGFADLHSDLPLGLLKRRFDGSEGSLGTEWLPRLRAGVVNVVVCAVYIDSIFLPEGALRRAVQLVDALLEEIAACPEIELALTFTDVERITAAAASPRSSPLRERSRSARTLPRCASFTASACACSPSSGCAAPRLVTAPGRTTRAAG